MRRRFVYLLVGTAVVVIIAMVWLLPQERPSEPVEPSGPSADGPDRTPPSPPSSRGVQKLAAELEWDEQIELFTNEFELSPKESFWSILTSDRFVGLSQPNRLAEGFREMPVVGGDALSGEQLAALRKTVGGVCTSMLREVAGTFTEYAKVMKASGHRLRGRAGIAEHLSEKTGTVVDPDEVGDVELFDRFCQSLDYDPAWEGIGFGSSKVTIHVEKQMPREQVGTWAGRLRDNIRTWNPRFVPEDNPEEALENNGRLCFADAALTVQRSGKWDGRIVQFHLRFWLNEQTGKWQLHQASSVREGPFYSAPTIFGF